MPRYLLAAAGLASVAMAIPVTTFKTVTTTIEVTETATPMATVVERPEIASALVSKTHIVDNVSKFRKYQVPRNNMVSAIMEPVKTAAPTDVDETNDEDDETDDEDDGSVVDLLHNKTMMLDLANRMPNSTQKELFLDSLMNSTVFTNETASPEDAETVDEGDETDEEDDKADEENDEADEEDDQSFIDLMHNKTMWLNMVNNMTNSTQKDLFLNSLMNSTVFNNETTSPSPSLSDEIVFVLANKFVANEAQSHGITVNESDWRVKRQLVYDSHNLTDAQAKPTFDKLTVMLEDYTKLRETEVAMYEAYAKLADTAELEEGHGFGNQNPDPLLSTAEGRQLRIKLADQRVEMSKLIAKLQRGAGVEEAEIQKMMEDVMESNEFYLGKNEEQVKHDLEELEKQQTQEQIEALPEGDWE
ncbi:hypothetical protein M409DRAFT_21892 [Zasmidium cellare ATCC 36951]|uniref:Uncharacterized protein n=1 Tax=Zasmidium cellare ATCC 36951 TaxID=1080233 RepID=A0A6A6CL16_ZASCE|nr:uncharacterized protein M409DRAFT_21892 [Zasmidium cellare ATCC 36951]KAF2167741.1 hypothetical protein M409DRAFT_21892 [Zasmidium cellare ATCC 36951]